MSNLGFYLQSGYKLVSENETSYTLAKKQSVGLHVLLFFISAGILNILYAIIGSRKTITVPKESK